MSIGAIFIIAMLVIGALWHDFREWRAGHQFFGVMKE